MDEIIRATAGDGSVKMAVIYAKDTVQRAKEIHNCSPTATAAFGRTLCAASLLGNAMKEEEGTLTIRINGGGPIGTITAVSDSSGNVRGCLTNPDADLPLRADGKLDVGGVVGTRGLFTLSKDIGLKEPYVGSTELVSGEIAEDLAAYLLESEQVASACGLGVLIDTDTSVKAAGGFIVQLLPGTDEALIGTLEDNIFMMDQLTTILDEDGPEAVFAQVLKGLPYHIVSREHIEYRCYCSRERVAEALSSAGSEELQAMIEEGKPIEVSCGFCDKTYSFTADDLAEIKAAL